MTHELGLQEGFESLRLIQLGKNAKLLLASWLGIGLLKFFLEPLTLRWILDVHILNTNRAAVGVPKNSKDLPKRCLLLTTEAGGSERTVEIPKAKTVGQNIEVGVRALLVLKRIGVCHQVTADAVSVYQLLNSG